MTPKQKAKELIEAFYPICHNTDAETLQYEYAKQCSIIAVDEILNEVNRLESYASKGYKIEPKKFLATSKNRNTKLINTMKVGYSKTFPNAATGEWEKIWCEEEFEGALEQAKSRWYAQKKEVENFHYESKGHDEKVAAEQKPETEVKLSPQAKIIAQIVDCTDIKVLQSFELLAKNQQDKHPEILAAYNQQLEKLKGVAND